MMTVHKEFGQSSGKNVDWIRRKPMSDFPCCDSIIQRSTQTKNMVNCRLILVPLKEHLRLFFAQLFLHIKSDFTEQSPMFFVVSTLFRRKMDHANQEDGSRDTKIRFVLEVTTNCLHGKHGIEIRILSLNGDNIHSWVRISHGFSKFVIDSNNKNTEVWKVFQKSFQWTQKFDGY